MFVTDTDSVSRRRAPLPNGPTAAPLIPTGTSERVAVVHMEIPAGGGLPEHAHGASEIVLLPLTGCVELRRGSRERVIRPGSAAHIATGERVSLSNPGPDDATLMVVASPPEFAEHLESWPEA